MKGGDRDGLMTFLEEKLGLSRTTVEELTEGAEITKVKDPRSKLDEEAIVVFETKELRDAVKAQGPNLAKFKDAGMRLDIPNYLQKDFKILMRLAFLLKKTNPDFRRNMKFDEDCTGLFIDIQMKKEAQVEEGQTGRSSQGR